MPLERIFVECVLSNKVLRVEVRNGIRVSDLIRELDLPLGFSCSGRGACVACIVYTQGALSQVSERERALLACAESDNGFWIPRVACLARVLGPVKIRTTYW